MRGLVSGPVGQARFVTAVLPFWVRQFSGPNCPWLARALGVRCSGSCGPGPLHGSGAATSFSLILSISPPIRSAQVHVVVV